VVSKLKGRGGARGQEGCEGIKLATARLTKGGGRSNLPGKRKEENLGKSPGAGRGTLGGTTQRLKWLIAARNGKDWLNAGDPTIGSADRTYQGLGIGDSSENSDRRLGGKRSTNTREGSRCLRETSVAEGLFSNLCARDRYGRCRRRQLEKIQRGKGRFAVCNGRNARHGESRMIWEANAGYIPGVGFYTIRNVRIPMKTSTVERRTQSEERRVRQSPKREGLVHNRGA